VNITYEEYLRSFYPHQEENIFTNNNWTLSDELVEIFQSNSFYKRHVRWNVQRFRPCEVMNDSLEVEDTVEASQPPVPTPKDAEEGPSNKDIQEIPQQHLVINEESEDEETTQASSKSVCTKRKAGLAEDFHEYPTRTQPRRMKKN
jgi:hypothetical protein